MSEAMRSAAEISASFDHTLGAELNQALQPLDHVRCPTGYMGSASSSVPSFVPWPTSLSPTDPPLQALRSVNSPVSPGSAAPRWEYSRRSAKLIYPISPTARRDVVPRFIRAQVPTVDSMLVGLDGDDLVRTSRALKASNISRLIRMVRDWTSPPTGVVPERWPVSEAARFRAKVLAADHRLLARGPEKELWRWFLDWREEALRADDSDLSATGLLKLLRRTLSRLRAGCRPASPVHRPPTCGDRLKAIA